MKQARPPVQVDRETVAICALDCALACVAVMLAAWLLPASVPVLEVAGPLTFLAAVLFFVSRCHGAEPAGNWLLAWGLALAAWFAWARMAGPWTSHVIGTLAAVYVLLTPFGPAAIGSSRRQGQAEAAVEDRERQKKELAKWARHFALVGIRNMEVTEVVHHVTGWEIHGKLGRATDEHGVVTFEALQGKAAEFDIHFGIGAGGTHFDQPDPDNAAVFVMHLYTKKGKRDTTYLPETDRHTTVNKPMELGLHANGRPFRMTLLYIVLMIIGVVDAGKSNLLGIIIAQLARCEDALICAIDLKGGLMVRPWVQPWIEGYADRPVIDWIATTRREADLMLDTLLAAGDYRAHHGGVGEKIRPRRDRPAVVLIVDESAVATSGHSRKDDGIKARELAGKIARLAETYRAMAFVPVVSAVRSDVETMGMTAFKAQSLARIGLRVSMSRDGESIFPDNSAAAKELVKIKEPGTGLALVKGQMFPPVHFHRITPKIAFYRAIQADPWRPEPDPVLRAGLGDAYAGRWGNPDGLDIDECYEGRWQAVTDLVAGWKANARAWRHDDEVGIGDVVLPARKRDAEPGTAPAAEDEDLDTDAMFREIVAREWTEDPEGNGKDRARHRVRELLRNAGGEGRTSGWLAKQLKYEAHQNASPELEVHRNTVIKWLRDWEQAGTVKSKARKPNDPYARWIWTRQDSQEEVL